MSSAPAVKNPPFVKALWLALIVVLGTVVFCSRVFLENDDVGFIYLLGHGFYAPWVSKSFCWLLLQLYSLLPGVGWYGVLHYLVLALDLGVLFKLVDDWAVEQGLSRNVRRWLAVAAILLFYPFILRITFTCSSILSGALGLLSLLAYFNRLSNHPVPLSQWIAPVLGFGFIFSLCYLVRPEGLGAMAFLLPAVLYVIWCNRKNLLRQGLALGFVFLLPLATWITLDKAVLRYPAAEVPYLNFVVQSNDAFGFGYTEQFKKHPEWLASVGWSRNDYDMLERFLYWDDTIYNQDKIDQLIAKTPAAFWDRVQTLLNPRILLNSILKTFAKSWLSNFPFTVYCLGLFILFAMMGTSRFIRWFPGMALAIIFTGSVLMQYVLRFPYRVAYPLIIVATLSLLVVPGFSVAQARGTVGGLKKSFKITLLMTAFCLFLFNGPIRWVKLFTLSLADTREKLAVLNHFEAQNFILREAGVIEINASDPLDPTPLKYPDIGPGWLLHSPPFYARLHAFGVPNGAALLPASINNPKILYYFKDANLPVLQDFMQQHYSRQVHFMPINDRLGATFYDNTHLYEMTSP